MNPAGRTRQLSETLKFISDHPLNRGRRVRALRRFLWWQIRSRLSQRPIVYPWVNGSRLIVRSGETGVTGNIYGGLHEFEDMAYLLHVTTPDDLFVDIGANVGTYTVLACAVKGAKGICCEPVPETYGRLLENLRVNDLSGRVEALNIGLADREGELRFTSGEDCMNHVVALDESSADSITVKVAPLDSVLLGKSPSLMKIDVEGFETTVLSGAGDTLNNASLHSVIIELNGSGSRYGFDENAILTTMERFGFLPFRYEPFARALRSLDRQKSMSGNTLFVRNLDMAVERIRRSPPVAVDGVML